MKYSQKQGPPASFVAWLGLKNEHWSPTYDDLMHPEMTDVRASLLSEQEHVCGYCGRALSNNIKNHIDHFRPQKHYNGENGSLDLTLSYDNFLLSCGPAGVRGLPSICGDAKGSSFDENAYISPWDAACETRFVFGSSGFVKATEDSDVAAHEMIKILNLSHASLELERSVLIQAIELAIQSGETTAEAELERLRTPIGGKRIGFSHAAARYLERELQAS